MQPEDTIAQLVVLLRVRPEDIWTDNGELEDGEVLYFLNEYQVWTEQVQRYLEATGLEKVQRG